ncbi:MAG: polysaccharide-degrading enzyme [Deltaproteobacteria bacterium]|nr:polysaccharide-degrading enzyme [Deltaproteobacteria bacterium]
MKHRIYLMMAVFAVLMTVWGCDDDSTSDNTNNTVNNTTSNNTTVNNNTSTNNNTSSNNTTNNNTSTNNNTNTNNNTGIDFETVIEVGPSLEYETPCDVPWESLTPSTLINIHYREEPYRCKFVVATAGTSEQPVVVRGIPSDSNELPVISGDNAITRLELDYWNEPRSVVKIGGVSHSSDFPSYITIENLVITSARPGYTFTDDSGNAGEYVENAAAVHIEEGEHITIRNCVLTNSGNGLFSTSSTSSVLVEGNYIHGNGIENSIYEHNNYTESKGITFQYNHFGPLRENCPGNNLKDRSSGTVIRFNWIEAGNRTVDAVDSDHEELLNDPDYSETYIYGNVLIKHDVEENGQVIHYGGDSGDYTRYRKGTLWFFNNTVYSMRSGNTTLLGISTNDESSMCFNNIVYAVSGGTTLAVTGGEGIVTLSNNWLNENWREVHGTNNGTITASDNITGDNPGFTDEGSMNFLPVSDSPVLNAGMALPSELLSLHSLAYQYVVHQQHEVRPQSGNIDCGAFERQ